MTPNCVDKNTQFSDEKILITGPTSQVGLPVAAAFAQDNEVYGLARFSNADDREKIEALGVRTLAIDLAESPLDEVPTDFSVVLHFAVVKSGDFDYDLAANAEGVGRLMDHCRPSKAFLHCSTGGVYEDAGHKALKETDLLGDNHRPMMPTYSICKIAAESMVRFGSRHWNVPTTIARFSVPYGDNGGWPWFHLLMMHKGVPIPVSKNPPSLYNLIHEDDYIAMIPKLVAIADVPPVTVNWGGSDTTSIEEWCAYMGELTGLEPRFNPTDQTIGSVALDPTKMHELVGRTQVDWRDGIARMVKARNPELLKD
ncbi:MAG: NAD(P)-dependent oxidoreductase [bacterium]|nr:NAD(P)-dependent oxidoreductase [bacterium]